MNKFQRTMLGVSLGMTIGFAAFFTFASYNVSKDLYITQAYDLAKQAEKFKKDPSDLKATDIAKFKYLCSKPLFVKIVEKNANFGLSDTVKMMCSGLDSLQSN